MIKKLLSRCLFFGALTSFVQPAAAFELGSSFWSEGRATFNVNFPVSDPSANAIHFQAAFIDAMNLWTDNSTFVFDLDTSQAVDPCGQDPGNGTRFTDTVCGDAYGSSTLAVALTRFSGNRTVRTGIVFNSAVDWGVTGVLAGRTDFRRVAVHELGHSLGLNHDAAAVAIMRPSIGSIQVPQIDDINGAAARYDLDNDGVGFAVDNCRTTGNADQSNLDNDALGDACDGDIDGDGIANGLTIDQSFGARSLDGFRVSFGVNRSALAQTFTAGISGELQSIAVPVTCGQGANLQVSIRTLDGQNPSSTQLGATNVTNLSSLAVDDDGFRVVQLANVRVDQGTAYAIVLDSNGTCSWSTVGQSDYIFGSARISSNRTNWSGLNFGSGTVDLPFSTAVLPTVLDNCPLNPNPGQQDLNNNDIGDACDDLTGDSDGDNILNGVDNCPGVFNSDQANFDRDAFGDACDADIDNDGALNTVDSDDANVLICSDNDNDQCDDCSSGRFNVAQDGLDTDADGACDVGDSDDDGDNVLDDNDNCRLVSNTSQANLDDDAFGDRCDIDEDNDGVLNGADDDARNPFVCQDIDRDRCNDCAIGRDQFGPLADNFPGNDGPDSNGDGICDLSDPVDDPDPDPVDDSDPVDDGFCFPIRATNGNTVVICL